MKKTKFYIIKIWGGVTPEPLSSAFTSYDNMVKRAKRIHKTQDESDGIFWMSIDGKTGRPHIGDFAGCELE